MSKIFLIFFFLFTTLYADKILNKTIACQTKDALKKAPVGDDYLKLNMYAVAHSCQILYPNSLIQVLGYDPRNSQEIYVKIVEKRTGTQYFILKSKVQVEQGGKKSSWRF